MFQHNKKRLFSVNGTVMFVMTPRTKTTTKTKGSVIAALLKGAASSFMNNYTWKKTQRVEWLFKEKSLFLRL